MYLAFQMCERLHTGYISNDAWAYRPKWEQIHWIAYQRIKSQIEEYDAAREQFDSIDLPLAEWMSGDEEYRSEKRRFADRIYRMKQDGTYGNRQ